jgi:hypothetical protein
MDWRFPIVDLGQSPDVHNERLKLVVMTFNAIGLASLIGGLLAPIFEPSRYQGPISALTGVAIWLAFLVAALHLLGYIRSKD